MNRRQVFKAIAAAPLAAKAAMEQSVEGAKMGSIGQVGSVGLETISPLDLAINKAINRWERDRGKRMRENSQREFPHYIAGRKSWSDAFKWHCFDQDIEEYPDFHFMTVDEKIVWLAKRGYEV